MSGLASKNRITPEYVIRDQAPGDGVRRHFICSEPLDSQARQSLRLYVDLPLFCNPGADKRSYAIIGYEPVGCEQPGCEDDHFPADSYTLEKGAPYEKIIIHDSKPWAEVDLYLAGGGIRACPFANVADYDCQVVDGEMFVALRSAYLCNEVFTRLDAVKARMVTDKFRDDKAFVARLAELIKMYMSNDELWFNEGNHPASSLVEVPRELITGLWNWRAEYLAYLNYGECAVDRAMLGFSTDGLMLIQRLQVARDWRVPAEE